METAVFFLLTQSFWLLLPAGLANLTPVLARKIPILDIPIDFNRKWKDKPIFGPHKTYRGFLFGVLTGILVVYLQRSLYPFLKTYTLLDYTTINPLILGSLLGFGALLGDLIKSFGKRRINIKSGKPWVPFDQLDYVLGSLFVVSFYITMTFELVVASIVLFGVLHPLMNLLGYFLKLKKSKF